MKATSTIASYISVNNDDTLDDHMKSDTGLMKLVVIGFAPLRIQVTLTCLHFGAFLITLVLPEPY